MRLLRLSESSYFSSHSPFKGVRLPEGNEKESWEFMGRSMAYWLPFSFFLSIVLTMNSMENKYSQSLDFTVNVRKFTLGSERAQLNATLVFQRGKSNQPPNNSVAFYKEGTLCGRLCADISRVSSHLSGDTLALSARLAAINTATHCHMQSSVSFSGFSGSYLWMVSEGFSTWV